MTWPAVVALILMFLAMLSRSPYFLLYLFFGLAPFGSLSMLGDTGGVNILPQSVCGVLLVCKLLLAKGQIPRAFDVAIDPAKLGFLFAFLFYALFSAYVMPRFFAHMMEIVEMNPVNPGVSLLQPAMANYNQSAYMMLSVGIALAFAVYADQANFRRHYIQALWVMGVVAVATGLADLFMAGRPGRSSSRSRLAVPWSPRGRPPMPGSPGEKKRRGSSTRKAWTRCGRHSSEPQRIPPRLERRPPRPWHGRSSCTGQRSPSRRRQ